MRSYIVILGLLFIALGHPSFAQSGGAEGEVRVVTVAEGAPLTVECSVRVEQRAEWRRDGATLALGGELRAGEAPRGGGGGALAAWLEAAAARPAHAGLYSCSRDAAAPRVRVVVLPRPHGEAGASVAAPSAAPPAAAAADDDDDDLPPIVTFDVNRHFSLNCTSPGLDTSADTYSWLKNGTEVEKVADLKDRYKLEERGGVFTLAARAHEDDFGNYTCLLNGRAARAWRVHARPVARLPANSNVVEGQKLKLTCKLIGKPYPAVDWTYTGGEHNGTLVEEALGARAALAVSGAGVERAELVVERAERGDAGRYECRPRVGGGAAAATDLRVKDMYAALWPFLGICAEVLVLCAVILVYERRRAKPDLDDSDTDNHDQ